MSDKVFEVKPLKSPSGMYLAPITLASAVYGLDSMTLDEAYATLRARLLHLEEYVSNISGGGGGSGSITLEEFENMLDILLPNAEIRIETLEKDYKEVDSQLSRLDELIEEALQAGTLTEMEIRVLEERLVLLEKEKLDIDKQYQSLIDNNNLQANDKIALINAKEVVDTDYANLENLINNAISDKEMTESEGTLIKEAMSKFSDSLANYKVVAQEAMFIISENIANTVVGAITSEEIFNKMTEEGKKQGLFVDDSGRLYVNGQYIMTRNMVAVDNAGNETFKVDSEGKVSIIATSFTLEANASTNIVTKEELEAMDSLYSINLSQDTIIIPTTSIRFPTENQVHNVDIVVYKGDREITYWQLSPVESPQGMTIVHSGTTLTCTVNTTSQFAKDQGYINLIFTIDGKVFNRKISWALAKSGTDGTSVRILGTLTSESDLPQSASVGDGYLIDGSLYVYLATGNWENVGQIKGEDGADGAQGPAGVSPRHVFIVSTTQVFKKENSSYNPSYSLLTPVFSGGAGFKEWQYSTDGGVTWLSISGVSGLSVLTGNILRVNSASNVFDSSNVVSFKVLTYDDNVVDIKSIHRVQDGADAVNVRVVGQQVFKYTQDSSQPPTPSIITVTSLITGLSNPTRVWRYKREFQSDFTILSSQTSNNVESFDITYNSSLWDSMSTYITIRCSVGNIYDDFTIYKVYDGIDGNDAYSVKIIPSSLVFTQNQPNSLYLPSSIDLTLLLHNTEYKSWEYSTDGVHWNTVSNQAGLSVDPVTYNLSVSQDTVIKDANRNSVTFRVNTVLSQVKDVVTLTWVKDSSALDIGGVNLLSKSGMFKDNSMVTGNTSVVSKDNQNVLKATGNVSYKYQVPIVPDQVYTFTANVWFTHSVSITEDTPIYLVIHDNNSDRGAMEWINCLNETISPQKWEKIVIQFKTNPLFINETYFSFRFDSTGLTSTNIYYIRDFKLETGSVSSGWNQSPEDVEDMLLQLQEDLENQLDGKVMTYSQDTDPKSQWGTDLASHTGDIWYDSGKQITYRFNGSNWERLYDQAAQNAQALANQKRRVFTTTPTPPYDVNDLWIRNQKMYRCTIASTTTYNANHWVEALNYIDKSTLDDAIADLESLTSMEQYIVINNDQDFYCPFNESLSSTSGVNPTRFSDAYLVSDSKFNGGVSIHEEVTNLFIHSDGGLFPVKTQGVLSVETNTSTEMVYRYDFQGNNRTEYFGNQIEIDQGAYFTVSCEMFVSTDALIQSPAVQIVNGSATNLTYDMSQKGTWQKVSSGGISSGLVTVLMYPQTSSSSYPSGGYVKYRNIQVLRGVVEKVFTKEYKVYNSLGYDYPLPENYTMMCYTKTVNQSEFSHHALTKSLEGYKYYLNGNLTEEFKDKWKVVKYLGPYDRGLEGLDIAYYKDPIEESYISDGETLNFSYDNDEAGIILRTFIYSVAPKTVTHYMGLTTKGSVYLNGTKIASGEYQSSGLKVDYNFRIGWNLVEICVTSTTSVGQIMFSLFGSEALLSDKTTHPDLVYMTAELPVEMESNMIKFHGRYNRTIDELVILQKVMEEAEISTYLISGKRFTSPVIEMSPPNPYNVQVVFE